MIKLFVLFKKKLNSSAIVLFTPFYLLQEWSAIKNSKVKMAGSDETNSSDLVVAAIWFPDCILQIFRDFYTWKWKHFLEKNCRFTKFV